MGCDIHMYPEYRKADNPHWMTVASRMNPGRDYDLFEKMAGVRGDKAMFKPRGLPDDVSLLARWDNELFISTESVGDEYCTPESAAQWVKSGSSHYIDDKQNRVTHPDWHSHSWLTTAELRQVLDSIHERIWGIPVPYHGLLAMLEEIDRRDHVTRVVFWFDN